MHIPPETPCTSLYNHMSLTAHTENFDKATHWRIQMEVCAPN